jgi:hypothetical protein
MRNFTGLFVELVKDDSMLLAQGVTGFEISRGLGMFVGLLIPATFLIYALKSLGEPDRSKKCALGLSFVMGGWTLCSAGYGISQLTGATALMALSTLVAVPVMLAGLVTAVLGLVDTAGSRKRGKGQAISSLIVGGLVLILALFAALKSDDVPAEWKIVSGLPVGARLSVHAKNFSVQVPPEEWVQVNPQKLNRQADLAFIDPKRKLQFMVLAFALPPGASITPEKFLEIARADLMRIDAAARVGEAQPEVTGSFVGTAFNAEAIAAGKEVSYRIWLYPHNNIAYQLIAWGPRRAADEVRLECSRFVKGFEVLTP